MTTATLDYLLRLALADRDKHARRMIEAGEEGPDEVWGEAAAAVKELLEMSQRAAMPAEEMRDGFDD